MCNIEIAWSRNCTRYIALSTTLPTGSILVFDSRTSACEIFVSFPGHLMRASEHQGRVANRIMYVYRSPTGRLEPKDFEKVQKSSGRDTL